MLHDSDFLFIVYKVDFYEKESNLKETIDESVKEDTYVHTSYTTSSDKCADNMKLLSYVSCSNTYQYQYQYRGTVMSLFHSLCFL